MNYTTRGTTSTSSHFSQRINFALQFLPKLSHVMKRVGMAKDFLTIFCADRQKNNSFLVVIESFKMMRGFASDFHERLNTGVGERLQGIINGTTWKSSVPMEVVV